MKRIVVIFFLFFVSDVFAMFCPTNFSNINLGDSLDQVLKLCGNPNSQNVRNTNENVAQEWIYYFHPNPLDQENTKMNLVIKDNKVLNIDITSNNTAKKKACEEMLQSAANNTYFSSGTSCSGPSFQDQQNVMNTTLCRQPIKVGDSAQIVQAACGQPAFVNRSQVNPQDPGKQIVELKYLGTQNITLVFEDNRLIDRQIN